MVHDKLEFKLDKEIKREIKSAVKCIVHHLHEYKTVRVLTLVDFLVQVVESAEDRDLSAEYERTEVIQKSYNYFKKKLIKHNVFMVQFADGSASFTFTAPLDVKVVDMTEVIRFQNSDKA
jgi:hypothetical protein